MKGHVTFRSKRPEMHFQIERRSLIALAVLIPLAPLLVFAAACFGNTMIAPLDVLKTIAGLQGDFVVESLRLPRALLSLLAGAGLGIAGAILQGIIRNPLASPDIVGITGGASVAAVIFLTYGAGSVSIHLLPFAAIAGALLVSTLLYLLSWRDGVTPNRLVLIGIGLAAAMSAATTLMLIISPVLSFNQAYIWMTGSVYGARWENVRVMLAVVALLLPLTLYFARSLNAQELGDDMAGGFGVAVQRDRLCLLALSVVLAGTAVAFVGAIGFVGLISPHIARRLVGRPFGSQVVVAGIVGGIIVLLADWTARTAFYPKDIPAGVFTAAIGAPFFLYLLFRARKF
ncbi:iron ABC transporter permease [Paenibacillus sp. HB172176]|uniref:FecCD family ABC transporter permease n=1 Tax=Paenibacillus sp. HB172176 TaxID=2493690 RepID=UPI001F0CEA50|nr:iron ABC transporter permease [Paenibacillus sp. HB172176]